MFVDSHCHLDYDGITQAEREAMMKRARAAGVGAVVTVGISKPEFADAFAIAESAPDIFCCVGVHPHEAEKPGEEITVEELVALSAHPKMIGIGETGLDYYYNHAPKEAQQRVFRQHIQACLKTGLPIVIHTRDAEDDTIRILKEETEGQEGKLSGVLHCFSSKRHLAEYALSIGFYISLSGMMTFNKSQEIRDIARDVPMDRLLIETDAPFLAPVPLRGKPCEPAHVVYTAKCLAEVKGVTLSEIERQTTENFFRLYPKANLISDPTQ